MDQRKTKITKLVMREKFARRNFKLKALQNYRKQTADPGILVK